MNKPSRTKKKKKYQKKKNDDDYNDNNKHKTFSMGKNITCTINFNYRITAIVYTLETLFVLDISL
jgi:hypothetical protein